jgi:predicted MFS family arabinose efflux permease
VAGAGAVAAFAGLLLFGWGMGASEVGINTEGTRLEALSGRPLLSSLHAGFSVGTVVGSAAGFVLQALAVPAVFHLAVVVALLLVPSVLAVRAMPHRALDVSPAFARPSPRADRDPLDRRLVLIGIAVLGMALAEGSANDWLPLVMVDGHGLDETGGAFTYLGFAAAMAAGRFAGPALIARFGRVAVLRVCAVLAALGLAVVILSPTAEPAIAAAVVWGLGASVGFPIAISAAADGAADPDRRVGQIVTTGYLAFLVGPPVLGLLGDAVGLRGAFLVVLAVVAVVVAVAGAVRPPITRAGDRSSDRHIH